MRMLKEIFVNIPAFIRNNSCVNSKGVFTIYVERSQEMLINIPNKDKTVGKQIL